MNANIFNPLKTQPMPTRARLLRIREALRMVPSFPPRHGETGVYEARPMFLKRQAE
jgi:hypothetical protein